MFSESRKLKKIYQSVKPKKAEGIISNWPPLLIHCASQFNDYFHDATRVIVSQNIIFEKYELDLNLTIS